MRVPTIYIKAMLVLSILGIFSGVIMGCGKVGGASIIENLVSEFPAVKQGESTQIECIIATGNGSGFTYEWTATGGSILGTSSVVTWTAPDVYGTYSVAVTVADENGDAATRELSINVTESG